MLIEDRIHISCPPDRVWAITIDINAWPDWVPTIQRAQVLSDEPFGVGTRAVLKQPAQPKTVWCMVACSPQAGFVWQTSGRLFRMRATHHLTPTDHGTDCYLNIRLQGPLGRLLGPLLKFPIKRALRQENKALKTVCEGSIPARTSTTTTNPEPPLQPKPAQSAHLM